MDIQKKAVFILLLGILMSTASCGSLESGTSNQIADIKTKAYQYESQINELRLNISLSESDKAALIREYDDKLKYDNYRYATLEKKYLISATRLNDLQQRYQLYDCIEDVEAGRFEEAGKKLTNFNETGVIYVTMGVYKGRVENIPLIISFAENLRSVPHIIIIYGSLVNELKSASDQPMEDIRIVAQLITSMESGIVDQSQSTESHKTEGEEVVHKATYKLGDLTATELEKTIYDNTFSTTSNDNINEIITTLYNIDPEHCNKVITVVFNRVYNNVGKNRLVQFIDSLKMVGPVGDSYIALCNTIKHSYGLHSVEMMECAFEFRKVAAYLATELLQNLWTPSLATIASGSSVAFTLYQRNETVYAGDNDWDEHRRNVFVGVRGRETCAECWNVTRRSDGTLSITNAEYGEPLFESNYYKNKIFTWKSKHDVTENSWQFHITTNGGVIIQNLHSGMVLTVSDDYDKYGARYLHGAETRNDGSQQLIFVECPAKCNYKVELATNAVTSAANILNLSLLALALTIFLAVCPLVANE